MGALSLVFSDFAFKEAGVETDSVLEDEVVGVSDVSRLGLLTSRPIPSDE